MIELNLDKLEKSVSPIFDRKTIMEQYGISISTLNRWTREQGLPFYKINRRVFIKRTDFYEWFERYRLENVRGWWLDEIFYSYERLIKDREKYISEKSISVVKTYKTQPCYYRFI